MKGKVPALPRSWTYLEAQDRASRIITQLLCGINFPPVLFHARRGTKKASTFAEAFLHLKCPGLDSNQHSLSATRPSSVRVYQFHHLGKGAQI